MKGGGVRGGVDSWGGRGNVRGEMFFYVTAEVIQLPHFIPWSVCMGYSPLQPSFYSCATHSLKLVYITMPTVLYGTAFLKPNAIQYNTTYIVRHMFLLVYLLELTFQLKTNVWHWDMHVTLRAGMTYMYNKI